ncbi:uncharacterized protein NECHADRAFT_98494 [Fusarium vanettenii 77-13-4]|uniref:Heterokaryon incompatibility domain-containing protein n=1 Tax=Fusarium vanettenii (strain ATCC MYA-4622 / CBS 123669 / FGSC 9596 / NRRL 45880 / 77-13-4) TaxID=660122 RepID=C7YVP2_FUSV7|nr:uncharacterized protein NECHADRAFT_98494 [Fusarium vanettenii 77-13-4]EEU43827.1 hypothetical protein NECHADRAFT_98494 [Fusarium vanettenii 77-13-4]
MAQAHERQPLLGDATRSPEHPHARASAAAKSARQHLRQENILRIHALSLLLKYSALGLDRIFSGPVLLSAGIVFLFCGLICTVAAVIYSQVTGTWIYPLLLVGLLSLGVSLFSCCHVDFMSERIPHAGLEIALLEHREAVACLHQFIDGVGVAETEHGEPLAVASQSTLGPTDGGQPLDPLPPGGNIVRVLELEPGTFDSEIRCRVYVISGTEGYEALSYAWGDSTVSEHIMVNDRPWAVTQNLATALRYLRYETKKRSLWVDATCINQRDDDEKNRVVGMMSYIYETAEQVLAFLGQGPDFPELFDFFHRVKNAPDIDEALLTIDIPLVLGQFRKLLDAEWWNRIWIIQEFAYAKMSDPLLGYNNTWTEAWVFLRGFNVLQERLRVDLLSTAHASYRRILSDELRSTPDEYNLLQMRHWLLHWSLRLHPIEYKVSDLLRGSRRYKASDPRDKIFALRSLMMEPLRTVFTPDYNLSTRKLYTRMAAYLLCLEQWEGIYNTFPIRTHLNLPSWVPDFSYSDLQDPLLPGRESGCYGLIAGSLECSVCTDVLAIRVFHIGLVDGIADVTADADGRIITTPRGERFELGDIRRRILDSFFPTGDAVETALVSFSFFNLHYQHPTWFPFVTEKEIADLFSQLSRSTLNLFLRAASRAGLSNGSLRESETIQDVSDTLRRLRLINVLNRQLEEVCQGNRLLEARARYARCELGGRLFQLPREKLEQELQDDISSNRVRVDKMSAAWDKMEKMVEQKRLDDRSAAIRALDGQVIVSTDTGAYGLGPANILRGDRLTLFSGVSGVFVIGLKETGTTMTIQLVANAMPAQDLLRLAGTVEGLLVAWRQRSTVNRA